MLLELMGGWVRKCSFHCLTPVTYLMLLHVRHLWHFMESVTFVTMWHFCDIYDIVWHLWHYVTRVTFVTLCDICDIACAMCDIYYIVWHAWHFFVHVWYLWHCIIHVTFVTLYDTCDICDIVWHMRHLWQSVMMTTKTTEWIWKVRLIT